MTGAAAGRVLIPRPCQGLSAAGPDALKNDFFMIARSAKLTTPSPLRPAMGSSVKNARSNSAKSAKFTMRSPVMLTSQALP